MKSDGMRNFGDDWGISRGALERALVARSEEIAQIKTERETAGSLSEHGELCRLLDEAIAEHASLLGALSSASEPPDEGGGESSWSEWQRMLGDTRPARGFRGDDCDLHAVRLVRRTVRR